MSNAIISKLLPLTICVVALLSHAATAADAEDAKKEVGEASYNVSNCEPLNDDDADGEDDKDDAEDKDDKDDANDKEDTGDKEDADDKDDADDTDGSDVEQKDLNECDAVVK